jgi:hypothetical protein
MKGLGRGEDGPNGRTGVEPTLRNCLRVGNHETRDALAIAEISRGVPFQGGETTF